MKRWQLIFLIVLTLISLVGEFFIEHDPNHSSAWWSGIPLFWAVFSFAGCILLIFFAKYIFKILVQRREDYYG